MNTREGQGRTLWIASIVAVALVAAVLLAILQVRGPARRAVQPAPKAGDAIVLNRVDPAKKSALQEQAELSDPTPLFLPTGVNTSAIADADLVTKPRDPGAVFRLVAPQLAFAEFEMQVVFPDPIALPKSPVAALSLGTTPNPYFTLGRESHPNTPLPKRAAFLEVLDARTGSTIFAGPLDVPATSPLSPGLWQPLELVAAVDSIGLVGAPSVTSSSGDEPVDTFFCQFIARDFRLGERLKPGFYTLRVGP